MPFQLPKLALCLALLPAGLIPLPGNAADTNAIATNFPGPLRLVLPPVLPAVPGVELNLYFANAALALNPAGFAFDVASPKGIQQSERWTFTPLAADVGRHTLSLEVRDPAHQLVGRAVTTIHVVPAEAGENREISLLILGDSLTAASVYSQQLLDLAARPGNPRLRLIGTRGPDNASGPNRHEGYGGWTAERFATRFTGLARGGDSRQCGSPFLYQDGDAKPALDFARYCREFNHGKPPDFVTILLGCNDTFSATEETLEERIDRMFRHYETLVQMIHALDRRTRIGALLLVPPAASQDAFGANYLSGQTRWQYRRNQHRVVERMLRTFGAREAENLFLVPTHLNLDCARNYPVTRAPANARSDEILTRQSNGVHPAAAGYRQLGDTIYCWLKAQLAADDRSPEWPKP